HHRRRLVDRHGADQRRRDQLRSHRAAHRRRLLDLLLPDRRRLDTAARTRSRVAAAVQGAVLSDTADHFLRLLRLHRCLHHFEGLSERESGDADWPVHLARWLSVLLAAAEIEAEETATGPGAGLEVITPRASLS